MDVEKKITAIVVDLLGVDEADVKSESRFREDLEAVYLLPPLPHHRLIQEEASTQNEKVCPCSWRAGAMLHACEEHQLKAVRLQWQPLQRACDHYRCCIASISLPSWA